MIFPDSHAARPAVGIWIKLPILEVIELVSPSGLDFVVLDAEHGAFDQNTIAGMVALARARGLRVFVRVAGHARSDVQPALDAGADGIFVPHVDDAQSAARVAEFSRFPPLGTRSASLATPAGGWGRSSLEDYLVRGAEVLVIAQIESPAAVDSVAEIAATEGIDAIFLGPFDLGLSSGLNAADAEFGSLVRRVETGHCTAALGGVASGPAEARDLAQRGYSFLLVGTDIGLLAMGSERLAIDYGKAAGQ